MYTISRMLLMLAVLIGVYCLVDLAWIFWPTSGYVIIVVVFALYLRRRRGQLTTLGSARWADEDDLRRTGMLGAETGLILGRLPAALRTHGSSIRKLFDGRGVSAKEACRQFLSGRRRDRGDLVRLPKAIHTAVFSPSGGGKGVSCVIPFLLTCPDSCVVVDFKGENFLKTAGQRRKMFGHRIVVLDPFKVATQTPDTFNPLDFIAEDSPHAIDLANDLAKALVIRTGEEREPHWNDSAEAWIAAVVATVVKYGGRDNTRSLQMVRDLLSHPQKLEMSVKLMCESDCWGGMLARMGGQLLHFVEKEKSSTLTTVGRHLRFLDTLAVADSTKSSSFDPAKLRTGKMTVYLVLPPDHMRTQSPLLRMWITSLLTAVVQGGLQERNKAHFLLDEAASLGHMDAIDDAVDKYRGYGVRLQLYFQSLGQLRKCFPDGQDQTLLSNTNQVFFGVNDNATADYVSARLGESTIVVESGGRSSGTSSQWSEGTQLQSGGGNSSNTSDNWQQQARKLLKPEEVMGLPARTAITLTPGTPPIRTTLLRYYEERRGFGRPTGWVKRCAMASATLITSATLLAGGVGLAVAVTQALDRHVAQSRQQPPRRRAVERRGHQRPQPGVPAWNR